MSDMQKNVIPGRRKGCPDYSLEFKQQLVATYCEPGISWCPRYGAVEKVRRETSLII